MLTISVTSIKQQKLAHIPKLCPSMLKAVHPKPVPKQNELNSKDPCVQKSARAFNSDAPFFVIRKKRYNYPETNLP